MRHCSRCIQGRVFSADEPYCLACGYRPDGYSDKPSEIQSGLGAMDPSKRHFSQPPGRGSDVFTPSGRDRF